MADIFISYSKAERRLTQDLAQDLEANGYTVWWDTNLISGDSYQKVIVRELEASQAAIVIWTPSSTQSEWVYSEANRAARRNKLIPIRVPEVDLYDIPPPFDVRQTDLVGNRRAVFAALAKLGVRPRSENAVTPALPTVPIVPAQAVPLPPDRHSAMPTAAPGTPAVPGTELLPAPLPPVAPASPVHAPVAPSGRNAPGISGFDRPEKPPPARANVPPRKSETLLALHWQRTKGLALVVLTIWVVIALGIHLAAGLLNQVRVAGFPLGYWLAAQGSLLGFLALLAWFVRRQNRIDLQLP